MDDVRYRIGGDTRPFENALTRTQKLARASAVAMTAGFVAVGVALNRAKDALAEYDRIGKAARTSGLDPEAYQEYANAADLAGLSVKQLDTLLRTFFKNANDAAIGTGLMKTSLEKLDPVLLENIQKAKSQEERLRLVADAVKAATSELDKGAIAQAAFGSKGGALINFLDNGADGFNRLAAEAREVGLIIDRDLIVQAEELNDKFSLASRVIDNELKRAFIEFAPLLVDITKLTAGLVREIANLVDGFRDLENQSTRSLDERLAEIGLERLDIETQILEIKEKQRRNTSAVAEAENRLLEGSIKSLKERTAVLLEEETKILDILSRNETRANQGAVSRTTDGPSAIARIGGSGAGRRDENARAAERQAEAIRRVTDALQFESEILHLNATEQRIRRELRAANVTADSEAGQQITQLVRNIENETAAIQRQNDTLQLRQDAMRSATSQALSLFQQIRNGSLDAEDALLQVLSTVINLVERFQQLNAVQGGGIGGSPLAPAAPNFLTALFGSLPSFEGGGSTGRGSRIGGIDGRGGFLAINHPNETIIDHTRNPGAGGIGRIIIDVNDERFDAYTEGMADTVVRRRGPQISRDAYDSVRRDYPAWQQNLQTTGRS